MDGTEGKEGDADVKTSPRGNTSIYNCCTSQGYAPWISRGATLSSCLDRNMQPGLPVLLVLIPSEISTSPHTPSGSFTGGHRGSELDTDPFPGSPASIAARKADSLEIFSPEIFQGVLLKRLPSCVFSDARMLVAFIFETMGLIQELYYTQGQ